MDIAKAKEFMYIPYEGSVIYISKDLWKLIEMCGRKGMHCNMYAIIETESGDTMMFLDWSYSDEPIIMGRFIHLSYFLDYYSNKEIIKL